MNNLGKKLDTETFFRALWKSAVASPNVRCPTVIYLDRNLPGKGELLTDEGKEKFLPETQTLVKAALKECLNDPELLTQRATMELLLKHFPISSGFVFLLVLLFAPYTHRFR